MSRLVQGAMIVACFVLTGPSVTAQDVQWRHDYAAARKEASSTGRPLLLDFGTEQCFWCKKLDATTFRLPAIATQLNAQFIPVKVDAEKDAWLAQAAQVDSYPTLVLLSPEGKVIARHVGYADGTQMTTFLAKIPAKAAFPSANPAVELLAQARADHNAGRFIRCLERCEELQTQHAATPEAAAARQLARQIAADPQKWQRIASDLDADLASVLRTLEVSRP